MNNNSNSNPSSSDSSSSRLFHEHDVLLGRGGSTNKHSGNQRYRTIVADHQPEYLTAKKKDKVLIARRIVALVQEQGGRFLKQTPNGVWQEVPDKRAQEKTSQALREGLDVRARMGTKTRPPSIITNNNNSSNNNGNSNSNSKNSSSLRKRSKASLARATARLAQRTAAVTPGTSIPTSPIVSPTMVSLPGGEAEVQQLVHYSQQSTPEALWMPHLSLSYDHEDRSQHQQHFTVNDENNHHHLATMPPVVRPMPLLQYAERQFSRSDVKDECAV